MTPKEKAEELVDEFYRLIEAPYNENAKEAAMIAVELALEFIDGDSLDEAFDKTLYLIEVKHEIEKL